MKFPIDRQGPAEHPRTRCGSGREILQTLGLLAQGRVVYGDTARPLKAPRGVYFSLAATAVAGMVAAVALGQLAARHVMRLDPPSVLAESDAAATAARGTPRLWADAFDARVPTLLPAVRLPDEAEHGYPNRWLP